MQSGKVNFLKSSLLTPTELLNDSQFFDVTITQSLEDGILIRFDLVSANIPIAKLFSYLQSFGVYQYHSPDFTKMWRQNNFEQGTISFKKSNLIQYKGESEEAEGRKIPYTKTFIVYQLPDTSRLALIWLACFIDFLRRFEENFNVVHFYSEHENNPSSKVPSFLNDNMPNVKGEVHIKLMEAIIKLKSSYNKNSSYFNTLIEVDLFLKIYQRDEKILLRNLLSLDQLPKLEEPNRKSNKIPLNISSPGGRIISLEEADELRATYPSRSVLSIKIAIDQNKIFIQFDSITIASNIDKILPNLASQKFVEQHKKDFSKNDLDFKRTPITQEVIKNSKELSLIHSSVMYEFPEKFNAASAWLACLSECISDNEIGNSINIFLEECEYNKLNNIDNLVVALERATKQQHPDILKVFTKIIIDIKKAKIKNYLETIENLEKIFNHFCELPSKQYSSFSVFFSALDTPERFSIVCPNIFNEENFSNKCRSLISEEYYIPMLAEALCDLSRISLINLAINKGYTEKYSEILLFKKGIFSLENKHLCLINLKENPVYIEFYATGKRYHFDLDEEIEKLFKKLELCAENNDFHQDGKIIFSKDSTKKLEFLQLSNTKEDFIKFLQNEECETHTKKNKVFASVVNSQTLFTPAPQLLSPEHQLIGFLHKSIKDIQIQDNGILKLDKIIKLECILEYIEKQENFCLENQGSLIYLIHSVCALKINNENELPTSQVEFECIYPTLQQCGVILFSMDLAGFKSEKNIDGLLEKIYLNLQKSNNKSVNNKKYSFQ